jgi:DNA-binding LytR/AlgR family response regulator
MSVYIGIIPITLVVVFHSNYRLSRQIKEMLQLNDSIADNIQKTDICCNITILSREQNKEYKINSENIIYIQSQDNYIKVITVDNDDIKLELIRTTLGYAERDIRKDCSHIIRCHNSYIVNLNNVKRVEGNSAGYKLQLKDSGDVIPVSRKYAGDVKAYFSTK